MNLKRWSRTRKFHFSCGTGLYGTNGSHNRTPKASLILRIWYESTIENYAEYPNGAFTPFLPADIYSCSFPPFLLFFTEKGCADSEKYLAVIVEPILCCLAAIAKKPVCAGPVQVERGSASASLNKC